MKSLKAGKYQGGLIQHLKTITEDPGSFHVFALPFSVYGFTSFHGCKLAATLAIRPTHIQKRGPSFLGVWFWSKELSSRSLSGLWLERRKRVREWLLGGREVNKVCYRL